MSKHMNEWKKWMNIKVQKLLVKELKRVLFKFSRQLTVWNSCSLNEKTNTTGEGKL